MDKRVIFATAGSGKTTYIVNQLSLEKRTLIVTYTIGNYENLRRKISQKFGEKLPTNITLMTYFSFLYGFCYKPFLSDRFKAKGIIYENNCERFIKQSQRSYFFNSNNYLYSNRVALLLEREGIVGDIKRRIEKYFDEFVVDEIQDIAGRDFSLLEKLMSADINMLFVGDFYQHTFDTSRDGNVNSTLFDNIETYESRFKKQGVQVDRKTLNYSWRCSNTVCRYIRENLGIEIYSNRSDENDSVVEFLDNEIEVGRILRNNDIIKLHYQNSAKKGEFHKNWGETKGEDCYQDVCVMLNKATAKKRNLNRLNELPQATKNKLYVAITRARGDVYLVEEQFYETIEGIIKNGE